jgi:predicted RNA methylase
MSRRASPTRGRFEGCRCLFVTALLLTSIGRYADRSTIQAGQLSFIGYEPTPPAIVDAMLELAHVRPTDVVYDLGSGDGRIVITAAQQHGARGLGIELQPGLVHASQRAAQDAGVASRVRFVEANFFDFDLSEATVVTMYLWPSVNDRLEAKLRRELRPGSRIVSYTFPIGKWVPDTTLRLENGRELFLWTVPKRPVREPDVPFVPTPPGVVDDMLRLAEIKPTDTVFDLGSGDGRIVIAAAQKYASRAVGIEIVPSLVAMSREVAEQGELLDKVSFIEGDVLDANLSSATVVILCLSDAVNAKLEPRLRSLRPGTRIVSREFPIGRWSPDKTVQAQDGTTLYLWVVRAR